MTPYTAVCLNCGTLGAATADPAVARFDALNHDTHPDDVEVHRTDSDGVFVIWRPADGLGEDGQSYIH